MNGIYFLSCHFLDISLFLLEIAFADALLSFLLALKQKPLVSGNNEKYSFNSIKSQYHNEIACIF